MRRAIPMVFVAGMLAGATSVQASSFVAKCLESDEFDQPYETLVACGDDKKIAKLSKKDQALVYWQMGTAYHWSLKHRYAVNMFDKSIALDEANAEAFNQRGWSKVNLRSYDSAAVDFLRAIELDSSLGKAHFGMAMVNQYQGNHSGRMHWLNRMLEADPGYLLGKYNYAIAMIEVGHASRAMSMIEELLALGEEKLKRVEVMAARRFKDERVTFYTLVLAGKAEAYSGLRRFDESAAVWTDVLQRWPNQTEYVGKRAEVHCMMKKTDDCLKDADRLIELAGYNSVGPHLRLSAMMGKDNARNSIAFASEVLQYAMHNQYRGNVLYFKAMSHESAGETAEAMEAYQLAYDYSTWAMQNIASRVRTAGYLTLAEQFPAYGRELNLAVEACIIDPEC